MKEQIVTALTNLIKIKSIVTLALTGAFIALALKGLIEADTFMMIFTTVIAFYFGTQKVKETAATDSYEDNYAEEYVDEIGAPVEVLEDNEDEYHKS